MCVYNLCWCPRSCRSVSTCFCGAPVSTSASFFNSLRTKYHSSFTPFSTFLLSSSWSFPGPAHTHTHTHTRAHARTHARTHTARTHTHTPHAHTHTHTQTNTKIFLLFQCLWLLLRWKTNINQSGPLNGQYLYILWLFPSADNHFTVVSQTTQLKTSLFQYFWVHFST